MLKTPIIESYPRTKLSQSKQLNRSKVTSHFLEEFKRKSEDDFGNSIGDENTRSNEMKSRFQREQRTRIVFQTQKRTAKVQNFQENSLVFQLRTVGKYGASWKVEWGFYGIFNGSAEGGRKKERKEQIIFILNQGRIENPAKNRRLFSQRSFIVDTWQGSEYASNSENNEATKELL